MRLIRNFAMMTLRDVALVGGIWLAISLFTTGCFAALGLLGIPLGIGISIAVLIALD